MPDILEFAPYRIDREQRLLIRGDQVAPLAPKIFDLLLVLAESGGRVLEKKTLLDKLWPDTFVEEGSLARNISTLRKVLGDRPNDQKYIATVSRRGYRFVAQVCTGEYSSAPALGLAATAALSSGTENRLPGQFSGPGQETLVQPGPSPVVWWEQPTAPPPLQNRSLAVGILRNVSSNDSLNHFAEILTEALMSELAQIPKLKVVPRSLTPNARHASEPQTKAGESQSDLFVEGSVSRIERQVNVLITFIESQTQSQIWSHSYDRDLGRVLALQEEVACSIAEEIRADLTPGDQSHSRATLVKPEAYDCYLRGRFYARRQNKEDNETAIAALERAVAIDPTFAMAYAELAQSYTWKLFLFAPHEGQWEEKAFVAVEKALSLDHDLAVAHLARGRLLWTPANHFPHARAVREYRRALALDPNLDEARNQLALVYCHIGFFDEALQQAQEAAFTNPNNHLAVYRTAQTLAFQGKFRHALAALRAIPQEVNPSLIGYQTAWVLFNLGNTQEASATIDQLLNDYPEDDGALFVSMQAIFAASAGDEQKSKAKIQLAIRTGKGFGHFHHAAYHIAIAFALMHAVEPAVAWLNAAAMDGFPCYPLFESDANLDNLRLDARFVTFMAQLRLQWLEYRKMF